MMADGRLAGGENRKRRALAVQRLFSPFFWHPNANDDDLMI
jgi:hypothetical protein